MEQETERKRQGADRKRIEDNQEAEKERTLEKQREAALKTYFTAIFSLLLHENLETNGKAQALAQDRTATTLQFLDTVRRTALLRFLSNTHLAEPKIDIIRYLNDLDLHATDLHDLTLSHAYLKNTKLRGAYISEAKLNGADLMIADLHYTDLRNADLRDAKLNSANFAGADLQDADLQRANLQGADLQKANLHRANFQDAILTDTNLQKATFEGANLQETHFQNARLIQVKGLTKEQLQTYHERGAIIREIQNKRYTSSLRKN